VTGLGALVAAGMPRLPGGVDRTTKVVSGFGLTTNGDLPGSEGSANVVNGGVTGSGIQRQGNLRAEEITHAEVWGELLRRPQGQ